MLGERFYQVCLHGVDEATQAEAHANCKAAWIMDKVVKNFIVSCWRARLVRVGRLKVVRGHIERSWPAA